MSFGSTNAGMTGIQFQNTPVTFSLQSTPDFPNYPYRGQFANSGITAQAYAEIVYSNAQITSCNYAPFCQTYDGGVYLYARADVGTQTIPTIAVGTVSYSLTIDNTPTSGSNNPVSSGAVASAIASGVHTNLFLYNNLTNYSHSGNNWDGFAFDNMWIKNNEETLIKRTTVGQNYSVTGVSTCLVIANLQLCAGNSNNAFGIAFEKTTLNGTIQLSQSGMAPRNDATLVWMGTMRAGEKLAWKVYGTFQGPQNYNSSCVCSISAIKIPDY